METGYKCKSEMSIQELRQRVDELNNEIDKLTNPDTLPIQSEFYSIVMEGLSLYPDETLTSRTCANIADYCETSLLDMQRVFENFVWAESMKREDGSAGEPMSDTEYTDCISRIMRLSEMYRRLYSFFVARESQLKEREK